MTSPLPDVEMPVLAEQARTILAGGRRALLTLPCANVRGWAGLIDDGGEPLLIVGADSPPVHCAGSGRRARVDICGHNGERLVLAGALRLTSDTTESLVARLADLGRSITVTAGDFDDLRILSMSVDDVLICLPEGAVRGVGAGRAAGGRGPRSRPGGGGSATAATSRVTRTGRSARGLRRANNSRLDGRWSALGPARRVDLDSYAFAEPDLVAAYAPDLIRHLNDEHATQMRLLSTHGVVCAEPAGATSGTVGVASAAGGIGGGIGPAGGAVELDDLDFDELDALDPDDATTHGLVEGGVATTISRDAVIGAIVTSLDRSGLDMWRIDIDGAREVRVAFRSPLVEPRYLGRELRLLLDDTERRTD